MATVWQKCGFVTMLFDIADQLLMVEHSRMNVRIFTFLFCCNIVLAADWPQWLGPQRDGVWREKGIVEKFDSKPKLRWKAAIGGGYAGPAVADGRVYVLDRQLSKGTRNPSTPFSRGQLPGTERVRCLNEADCKLLWKHEYDCPYAISYPA